VHVKLSGISASDYSQQKASQKTKSFMAQSADYNVAIWHQQDLLLQTIDWQAKPINNAQALLVCEGQLKPIVIGNTKADGTLWLKSKQWQGIYQEHREKECWIWTQLINKVAAIKLPFVQHSIRDSLNIFAWSAQPIYQPGDRVNIGLIARKRSENGLLPVTNLDDYKIELLPPDKNNKSMLNIAKNTSQGFAKATHYLAIDAAMGSYRIHLTNKHTGAKETIGRFTVAEFTPPEFEQFVQLPTKVNIHNSFEAKVSARRMNGVVLKDAKVKLQVNIKRKYWTPENWPQDYEFNTWADFDKNKNGKESFESVDAQLDDQGNYTFISELLESTVPYGTVIFSSEILSDDGEVQYEDYELSYFSRNHYIGTKFDQKTKKIHVVAIDEKGQALSNVAVEIEAFFQSNDRQKPKKSFTQCNFNTLPNTCKLDVEDKTIRLIIKSGEQQYDWYRSYYSGRKDSNKSVELKETFELKSEFNSVIVGEKVEFELTSSLAGKASFILQAGDIKKVWQQDIKKGKNTIKLNVDASWLPYARVYASLSVGREVANERAKHKFLKQNKPFDFSRPPMPKGWIEELLGSQRFLTTSELIIVKSKNTRPEVKLSFVSEEVKAGSDVVLTVNSNVDAESQVWLVNDALLSLMSIKKNDYDYHDKLISDRSFESELNFDSLTEHLILDSIFDGDKNSSLFKAATAMNQRRNSGAGLTFNMPSAGGGENKKGKVDFAQSIWLDTITLKANTTKNVTIKLPQLIGRWKIFTLTATSQTMSIDSTSITTVQDVEYFFDAPRSLFNIDKASFAVTQINKGKTQVSDQLNLSVDGKKITTIDIQLKSGEYKRTTFTLPELTTGKHILMLTSETQPDFATYHEINVLDGVNNQQQTWLIEGNKLGKVTAPNNVISGSVKLSKLQTGQLFPDWHALSNYDRNYPHQCWEQTVSRALSYQFNPVANKVWTEGEAKLKQLIGQKHKHQSYFDMFSYFPDMNADPFLTAYTYLAHSWLENSSTPITLDTKIMKEVMEKIIGGGEYVHYFQIDAQAKSMALFALAQNKDINLEQALTIRQKLGKSNAQATVLQALALKALNADKSLYLSDLLNLSSDQYVDNNNNIFNKNSEKCLAALAFSENSIERESLLSEVILQQQKNGRFGSTFANAVCSYALKNSDSGDASFTPIKFNRNDSTLSYDAKNSKNHWLRMNYQQNLQDVEPLSSGITISRILYVQNNNKWQPVNKNTMLNIGDIVKTTFAINGALDREHIAMTDSIPGGFEVINPALGNQLYMDDLGRDWPSHTRIEIREGKAFWYLRHLTKGERKISYYSRVRHVGTFNIAPAKIEAMYRSDVFALTKANKVKVTK